MSQEKLTELTKRIYRLTLLFPKKEPLRYKLREIANEILAQFIIFQRKNPIEFDSKDLILNFEILNSFLEIAKHQNWVSPGEISEIQNEYQKFLNNLKEEPQGTKISIISPTNEGLRLNERQKRILEILKEKEKIQVWQLKEIFPQVSKRTLRRDFQKLWKRGIIERIGEKTNTFYKLK